MSYSYEDLLEGYSKLGVERGQVVYVGTSLPYLREFDKPGKKVLLDAHFNALMKTIGEEGTIVVFAQSTPLCNTKTPFNPETTSCISGIFSEYLRKKDGAYRSFHPFCSYAAFGKYAQKITQDTTRHAYGPETPMARMLDLNTLSISIGMPPRMTCSTIHHLEMIMGVPYRYPKEFVHPVVRDGKVQEELFYLYVWYRDVDIKRDRLKKIFKTFAMNHEIKSVDIGAGQIFSYSMREFFNHAVQLFKEDIYVWLEEPPKTRPYRN